VSDLSFGQGILTKNWIDATWCKNNESRLLKSIILTTVEKSSVVSKLLGRKLNPFKFQPTTLSECRVLLNVNLPVYWSFKRNVSD
jgi:hypothetical protein